MDFFFPLIIEAEKNKKKQKEMEQLYIEIEPPRIEKKDEEAEEAPRVIVIEL